MKPQTISLTFDHDGEQVSEQINIRFNMAVEIAYEKIAGKPFSAEALNSMEGTVALYYAAIIANNPKTEITMEDLMLRATAKQIVDLRDAVLTSFEQWATIPDIAQEEMPGKGDEGNDSPN